MLFKGIIAGLVTGLPVGTAAALSVQNNKRYGFSDAMFTSLGASLPCLFYICVSVVLTAFCTGIISRFSTVLYAATGIILIIDGIIMMIKKNKDFSTDNSSESTFVNLMVGFMVGFSRPVIIFELICIYNGCGAAEITFREGIYLAEGTYIGVIAWWLAFNTVTAFLCRYRGIKSMNFYDTVSGFLTAAMGTVIILTEKII